jgi:EmrB/QacA subfamily drug resistance transporter
MATMDFSIVNVALPTLAREFDASPDTVLWATLTGSLVATGLTLTAGRLGDIFGRKPVYLAGWVIFTVGMAATGAAQTIGQLIAMRVVQAIGVALALGNGNAIVVEGFPERERGRALGTTGAVVGAGLMSGPILGGLILSVFDWRALFYVRVPIGLIALTLALIFVRRTPVVAGTRRLDIAGAIMLFLTLVAAILAVNRGQAWGWTSPAILGLFAVSAASLALFVVVERRAPSPVVSLALFRIRAFTASVLSLVLNFGGQAAVTLLMPFYLIQVRGLSTARAGIVIGTVPAMMLVLSPLSGYLADRFASRYQPAAGAALVGLGLLSLATLGLETPLALVVVRLALVGLGTALFQAPNSSTIMNSVPRDRLGTASASVATARNIGNATGIALMGTIMVAVASTEAGTEGTRVDDLPVSALLAGIRVAFVVAAAVSSVAIVTSLLRGTTVRRPEEQEAGALQPTVVATPQTR